MFTKLNPGTGDKPLFLKPDMAIIVRSIVLAFRLRSRHPVRPKGRTAYNGNAAHSKNFLFMMTYGTDRRGSVPPYSIARQFYSPRPPHTRLRLRSGAGVGLGELARL